MADKYKAKYKKLKAQTTPIKGKVLVTEKCDCDDSKTSSSDDEDVAANLCMMIKSEESTSSEESNETSLTRKWVSNTLRKVHKVGSSIDAEKMNYLIFLLVI